MNSGNNKPTPEGLTSPASAMNLQRAESAGFDPELLRSLRMRPRLAAWVAAGVLLVLIVFALSRKPVYSAQSLTYVEPQSAKVLGDTSTGAFDAGRYDSYLQQQMQTAIRPDILTAALRRLPPGAFQLPHESDQSAVARLQKQLKVERVLNSYQLSISLQGPDPDAVAATVNAVTNAYLEQGRKDEHETSSQRLQLLTQERQRIQSELAEDRTEQATLSTTLGVANPTGETGNPYDVQLAGVRTQLAAARSAHDVALAQLASVKRSGGAETAGLNSAADDALQTDPGLAALKATINQRKALLSSQMAGLTPSNPVYKQDQEEMADLDRSLDKQTAQLREQAAKRVEDKLGLELQRTASVEGMLNAQLAHQTATATGAAPKLQRASELAADITRLTTRFAAVDDAIRGLELEANGPGLAHLSVAASVPLSPEPSKRKLLLLLALPLALAMGAAAAVVAHKRDPLVYTEQDLQSVLGFPPIGVLPSRDEVGSATIEEYVLRLAAGIETAYRVSDARSFVFTAASPTVSVTGLVIALQEKLEELGFTVLITQAPTLLQPHVGGVPMPRLKADAGAGSLAVRRDEGHEGYAATNLTMLKRSHDLLLIDAPPLLHSAAAEYAVRSADAAILIAGSALTLRTELVQAATLLDRLNVAGVGAVLKDLQLKHADPSFKAAIAVLESRWNAHAQDAARAVQAQRAARGAQTSAQPQAGVVDALQETASTQKADVEHQGISKEPPSDPSSMPTASTPTSAAQDLHWAAMETSQTITEDPQVYSMHEAEFVEEPQSNQPAVAQVPEPATMASGTLRVEEAPSAGDEEVSSAVPPLPLAEQEAETTEETSSTKLPRPGLVFEPEDEPSERARLWLERLLNPNAVSAPAPAAREFEAEKVEETLPQSAAVETEAPVAEFGVETIARTEDEPRAQAAVEELPSETLEQPAPVTVPSYRVVPMYPPRPAVTEIVPEHEAAVEEAAVEEEYPVFHQYQPSTSINHPREAAEEHETLPAASEFESEGPSSLLRDEDLADTTRLSAEPSLPDVAEWSAVPVEATQERALIVSHEEFAPAEEPVTPHAWSWLSNKHDAPEPAHEEVQLPVTMREEEPVFEAHAPEAFETAMFQEEALREEPVPNVLPTKSDRPGELEYDSPWAEANHSSHATERTVVTAPEMTGSVTDSINGLRHAALLRHTASVASTAKLPARSEGKIQPETGRMTRNWGMLSRFGGEAKAVEAEPAPDDGSRQ